VSLPFYEEKLNESDLLTDQLFNISLYIVYGMH